MNLVFGILLSGVMATVFAGLFPFLALGFTSEWLMAWGTGILISWPLGFGLESVVNKPLMEVSVWMTHPNRHQCAFMIGAVMFGGSTVLERSARFRPGLEMAV